jgi:polysaccharide pyruvyl transferase WcaK-like protein
VRYIGVDDDVSVESSLREADLALLMGDTPVMDAWGVEWPLAANARTLDLCRRLGKPVHAVGVGVDRLEDPNAIRIFREHYTAIESWTVRSEECRAALEAMGVERSRVLVGADWAWLFPLERDRGWAEAHLREQGMDLERPAVGVNLVNELWSQDHGGKRVWAALLERLIDRHGIQVLFFCNESRAGDYFDRAAAEEVRALMGRPSGLVADRQYTPSEMVSVLECMRFTISQRYHFTLFSVLAGVIPVSIERGQKMRSLNRDLALPFVGTMERPDEAAIEHEVDAILSGSPARLAALGACREQLRTRARANTALLEYALSSGGR